MRQFQLHLNIPRENIIKTQIYVTLPLDPHYIHDQFSYVHSIDPHLQIMHISRGGGGRGPDPLKNHKNIGFLNNTGPDPLK